MTGKLCFSDRKITFQWQANYVLVTILSMAQHLLSPPPALLQGLSPPKLHPHKPVLGKETSGRAVLFTACQSDHILCWCGFDSQGQYDGVPVSNFLSRWHRSARKDPYTLCQHSAVSAGLPLKQFPCLTEQRSFQALGWWNVGRFLSPLLRQSVLWCSGCPRSESPLSL